MSTQTTNLFLNEIVDFGGVTNISEETAACLFKI
jgi:hypothetical protein